MATDSRFKMSQERYDALKEELQYLETDKAKEVSEQIKEARSFGDLSENSEYDEAKTEQGKLYSKIAEIKVLLENAEIVEKVDTGAAKGAVTLGSVVKTEMEAMLHKVIACCVPASNQAMVIQLVNNEAFHYVEPRHRTSFLDTMWHLGEAIQQHRYVDVSYGRLKDRKIVKRRLKNRTYLPYLHRHSEEKKAPATASIRRALSDTIRSPEYGRSALKQT